MKVIKNYPQKSFDHAVAAVDVVLFTVSENKLKVLLLKLKEDPFKDSWALPGGLLAPNETLGAAAQRHLKTKVGVNSNILIEQLYTFGDPDRDPNGWVISVAYMALIPENKFKPNTQDRYADIEWHDVSDLPKLAYDHKLVIQKAIERLKSKLEYTNIIYTLMPEEFTLTQLQKVYETILSKNLDKRNFRKKILSLGIIKSLKRKSQSGTNRPAELYSFTSHSLQEIKVI